MIFTIVIIISYGIFFSVYYEPYRYDDTSVNSSVNIGWYTTKNGILSLFLFFYLFFISFLSFFYLFFISFLSVFYLFLSLFYLFLSLFYLFFYDFLKPHLYFISLFFIYLFKNYTSDTLKAAVESIMEEGKWIQKRQID